MKKLEQGTRLVIGKNSVKEALRWAPERIVSFLAIKEPQALLGESEASQHHWQKIDFDSLTDLAKSDSHQGIALIVKDAQKLELKPTLKALAAKEKARIVVLTTVQDP